MNLFKKFLKKQSIFAMAFLGVGINIASAQIPTPADLIDNNLAFIKMDRNNVHLNDTNAMHFVAPVTVNGLIYTYYNRGINGHLGVGLATTTDGISFTDQGAVLSPDLTSPIESSYTSFPGIWYDNGIFYLVYEAAGDSTHNGDIGLATSADGIHFAKQGIIVHHNTTGWESVNIGTPSLYKENGV